MQTDIHQLVRRAKDIREKASPTSAYVLDILNILDPTALISLSHRQVPASDCVESIASSLGYPVKLVANVLRKVARLDLRDNSQHYADCMRYYESSGVNEAEALRHLTEHRPRETFYLVQYRLDTGCGFLARRFLPLLGVRLIISSN